MNLDDKSICVTGCAGFVGSHLVEELAPLVKNVKMVDNLTTGNPEKIRELLKRFSNTEFYKADVREYDIMKKLLKNVDIVFHEAANVDVLKAIKEPLFDIDNNARATLTLLKASCSSGVKKFIYASSAAVYGDCNKLPIKEDVKFVPISPYGISKFTGELYVRMFHHQYDIDTVALRYFNIFGIGQNPSSPYSGVITKFMHNAIRNEPLTIFGDGSQTRDFVGVKDIVHANILTTMKDEASGHVMNISNNKNNIIIKELANMIISITNSKSKVKYSKPREGDILHSKANITLAREIMSFEPKVSLKEGIVELYKEL